MDIGQIASRYPVLYHMAEDGSWESIRRLGLLSTSALLNRFEVEGGERFALESRWRPNIAPIEHCEHGVAFIRDQRPMPEDVLLRCLYGMTPRDWYEMLNRKVFFWVGTDRLERFLNAYSDGPRIVLTVDTTSLLNCYAEQITLSSINSGAPFRGNPSPRGVGTFKRVDEFPANGRIAELAVDCAVPDIADFVLSVSRWRGGEELEEVWRKG